MSKKVLIVEDEEAMSIALSDKIKKVGYNVICAYDGEEGYELAMREKPDLIMLDIIMPKIDGLTLMKMIRKESGEWGENVIIIMLTNLNDPESISEASVFGVYDFLVKTDWKLEDIADLVKSKLN